jgi:S-adenosylmethionine-diacylgycerolhomoserine-N-methlytransferase
MIVTRTIVAGSGARMDAIYARQRHIYDLTRKYYLLGRDRLIARLDVPKNGSVMEIGCGTGRNLIAVARRYPTARLYGLDISEAMLATARANIARAGLTDRIVLKQADATDFDAAALFGQPTFDRVFFSYTLSMIPDWKAALSQGVAATAGTLSLVDFGQQGNLPHWFRKALRLWLAKFDVEPRADLFAAINEMGNRVSTRQHYRGYAWSAKLTR